MQKIHVLNILDFQKKHVHKLQQKLINLVGIKVRVQFVLMQHVIIILKMLQ